MRKGHLKRKMIASHFHVRHLQKKEKGPMTRKHSKAAVENRSKHVFFSVFSFFSSFSNTSLQTKQPSAFPPFYQPFILLFTACSFSFSWTTFTIFMNESSDTVYESGVFCFLCHHRGIQGLETSSKRG